MGEYIFSISDTYRTYIQKFTKNYYKLIRKSIIERNELELEQSLHKR